LLTEDIQGGHQPRKDVKVREFESGQGKVWKKSRSQGKPVGNVFLPVVCYHE